MASPLNPQVEATPNFLANLEAAHQFFILQDAASAPLRLAKLRTELREMIQVLAWSPAGGRPARFVDAKSAQARLKTEAVMQQAEQAGLPSPREYVVSQHIVLYAHADSDVVLLAIKHRRQLVYSSDI